MIRFNPIFWIFAFITVRALGQDLFSDDNSQKYCVFLSQTGQFDALLKEQLRLYNLTPASDSIHGVLYNTYLQLNNYDQLVALVNLNRSSFSKKKVLDAWVLGLALDSIQKYLQLNPLDTLANKYSLIHSILSLNLKKAKKKYEHIDEPLKGQLSEAMAILKTRPKSAIISGTLSAIVPGLGKLYLGKKRDAISAFTATGVFVWQAIVGFNKKGLKSSYGLINGTFGLGFYLGNIYGSVRATKIHNHERTNAIYNQVVNSCILD